MLSTASVSFVNAMLCDSGILMQIFAGHFEHVLALLVYSRQNTAFLLKKKKKKERKKGKKIKNFFLFSFFYIFHIHFQHISIFHLIIFGIVKQLIFIIYKKN